MFKKSLAAVALLGAFAGSAFAADVTLYGVVDEGFLYTHKDADKTGVDAVDKLELKSGIQAGSRWGLKGTEDLGNGLKVGFILESGFNADDGTQSVSGTMFNREASLNVMGPFGQLSLGKIGAITQGTSSWGKVGAVSAFGTSYGAANVGNATNVFCGHCWRDGQHHCLPDSEVCWLYGLCSVLHGLLQGCSPRRRRKMDSDDG